MRATFRAVAVVLLTLAMSGCGEDPGFIPQPPPAGLMRVVNAVSDSTSISASFQAQGLGNILYLEATTLTPVLPEVPREFTVSYFDGANIINLVSTELTVGVNFVTSVIVTGTLANPQLIVVEDPPPVFEEGADFAEVRLVHAATRAPAAVQFLLSGGTAVNETVSFGETSALLNLTASDNYLMAVNDGASELWNSGTFNLVAQGRPLFVLVDHFGPAPGIVRVLNINAFQSNVFPAESLPSALRVDNFIADRTSVDFLFDGVEVVGDFLYGDRSDYIDITAETVNVQVTIANDPATILADVNVARRIGDFQTVKAIGIEAGTTAITTIDDRRPATTNAQLNITNASFSAGTVDVYTVLPSQNIEDRVPNLANVAYQTGNQIPIVAGTYNLFVTTQGTNNILVGPQEITVNAGGFYSVDISDSNGGGLPPILFLGDDFGP